MIEIAKLICLFLWVLFGSANTIKVILNSDIPAANVLYMSVGATGFIWLQWL